MGYSEGHSDFRFGARMTPVVKQLIIINAVIFLLQNISFLTLGEDYLATFFGLNSYWVLKGMVWQPVTYMFLHHDPIHIIFNMFALWMFGSNVEAAWGRNEFLKYYIFTGTAAGLCSLVTSLGVNVITIGASGAIFGLLVAFGMLFPDARVLFMFIFPMRAKHFVLLFAGLELWMTLGAGPRAGGVARFAHLGGMLFGYLYLKFGDKVTFSLPRIPRIRFNVGSRKNKREEPDTWNSFMENEIDPILDKISREGFGSLTKRERKLLKKGRGNNR